MRKSSRKIKALKSFESWVRSQKIDIRAERNVSTDQDQSSSSTDQTGEVRTTRASFNTIKMRLDMCDYCHNWDGKRCRIIGHEVISRIHSLDGECPVGRWMAEPSRAN